MAMALSALAIICLAKILLLLIILAHKVFASHHREYELLFLNAIKIANALPKIPEIVNGKVI
jgi:hypothetical protein